MRVRGTEVGRCPGSRGLLDVDGETGVKKPELEPTCTVYNINPGKNRKLLSECPVLGQYMLFVGHMREYLGKDSEKDLGKAIDKAMERCIREDVLREFLMRRRWHG